MKIIFIYLALSSLLFSTMLIAQTSTENFRIPKECIGEKFYITKCDEITPFEAYQIVNKDNIEHNDSLLNIIDAHNLIYFRKLNNYISTSFKNCRDSSFVLLYDRDIDENNNARFLISSTAGKSNLLNEETASEMFYIYDRKLKITYKSFPSLESLIYSLQKTNNHFKNKPIPEITQEKINQFSETSIPKGKTKKEVSKGAKITGQVLLYLVLTILGAFFASLL